MLDVKRRIEVITALLEQRTPESATYAALECRLAIEYLCYQRMQMALELASYADMGGWQPSKVIKAVEQLVDEEITGSFTLSIAAEPELPSGRELTLQERKNLDYHLVGTQAPLDMKKLTRLWNALASRALHVQVPKSRTDPLSIHGDIALVTEKVQECLTELKKIADGTLISNGFGPEVSIVCVGCDHPVRRRTHNLADKQTVSCANPDCSESYTVTKASDEEFTFERRVVTFDCSECRATNAIPWRQIEKMKMFEVAGVACVACSVRYRIGAQASIAKVPGGT